MQTPDVTSFESRHAASRGAAGLLAESLAAALKHRERTALVVSGGSTPGECLEMLAAVDLPWPRISVLPTDERCVPTSDRASNERMIRERLLVGPAGGATFLRLAPERDLEGLLPFGAVLAGMGEDGHFASLFPDIDELAAALDPSAPPACLHVRTTASPHRRITLNLAALAASDAVVLLAFGEEKRRIIDTPAGHPVAALLHQTRSPVHVVWAP